MVLSYITFKINQIFTFKMITLNQEFEVKYSSNE